MRSVHTLKIQKEYLDLIRAKVKTIDMRTVTDATKLMKSDDLIKFVCGSEKIVYRLKWRTEYASLGSCLHDEGVENVMPGFSMTAALRRFKQWSSFKPACVAVFAFHVEILESVDTVDLEATTKQSVGSVSGLKRPFKSSSLETGEPVAKIVKVNNATQIRSNSSVSAKRREEIVAQMNSVTVLINISISSLIYFPHKKKLLKKPICQPN
ncbi:uncharacterized protein LOC119085664 [Bradysia coprophila]|uniref:uncharacterized protein LOC119085664 n=1 Tax=Bradysia coprophila TaxID=38358 RepID=UPI00187D8AD3|nr:uncharacterized protein LOC119085664 [Bradysia coprophila]